MPTAVELDVAVYLLAGVFAAIGLWRGLSGELANFCAILAALACGIPVHSFVAPYAAQTGLSAAGSALASWGATVAACIVVFGLVYKIIGKTVSFLVPQPTNAIFGIAIGAVKGFLIAAVAIGFLRTAGLDSGFAASRDTLVSGLVSRSIETYARLAAP